MPVKMDDEIFFIGTLMLLGKEKIKKLSEEK
jgi:hypothetical protein